MSEAERAFLQGAINREAAALEDPKKELTDKYGQLWDTKELQQDYTVHGFMAPFVKVTRKSDGVDGLLMFSHRPRFYHSFEPTAHDRSSGITIR